MKIDISFKKKDVVTTLTINPVDEAVTKAVRKLGYQARVPDPNITRKIEIKQAEVWALEVGDPARATKEAELAVLRSPEGQTIKNPVGREEFLTNYLQDHLVNLLVDEQSIQQETQVALQQKLRDRRIAAKTELGLPAE